jgi:hypothetical protein
MSVDSEDSGLQAGRFFSGGSEKDMTPETTRHDRVDHG